MTKKKIVNSENSIRSEFSNSSNTIEEFEELFSLFDVTSPVPDLDWKDEGLCAQTDPESFFPEKGSTTRDAKKVCMKCSVREICLAYALENDERFGIWGGLSERERRKIKKAEAAES